jgi:hypothetical protein
MNQLRMLLSFERGTVSGRMKSRLHTLLSDIQQGLSRDAVINAINQASEAVAVSNSTRGFVAKKRWHVDLPLLTAQSCSCMSFRGEEGTPDAQSALFIDFGNGGRKLCPTSG